MKLLLVAISLLALHVAVAALALRAPAASEGVAQPMATEVAIDEAVGWSGTIGAPHGMAGSITGSFW